VARLLLLSADAPQAFEVADTSTLGRHPDCDVPIIDGRASKNHAVVERHGDTFVLRDLGSMNGTFLNGARIEGETQLEHGDEITIGAVRVRFEDPEGTAASPALARLERQVVPEAIEPPAAAPVPGIPAGRLRSSIKGAPLPRQTPPPPREDAAPKPGPRAPSPPPRAAPPRPAASPASPTAAPKQAFARALVTPNAPRSEAPPSSRRTSTRPYPGELPVSPAGARGPQDAAALHAELDDPISLEHAVVHPRRRLAAPTPLLAPNTPVRAGARVAPVAPVEAPAPGGDEALLRAFHDTVAAVVEEADARRQLERLLDGLLAMADAERVVVFVAGDDGQLAPRVVRARHGASLAVAVSTIALLGVMRARAAKVVGSTFGRTARDRSNVALPILAGDRAVGVLWLEGAAASATSARSLRTLRVAAGLGALLLGARG
jgi:adenylate cyclase